METNEIIEGNILIAEFMGYKVDEYGNYLLPGALKHFNHSNHSEWCGSVSLEVDWANPEEAKLYAEVGGYYWEICPNNLEYDNSWDWLMPVLQKAKQIPDGKGYMFARSLDHDLFSPIELVWRLTVQFIKSLDNGK